jgi:two-component system sensor histidine kinase KdpD
LLLAVKDAGAGLTADERSQVGERFFRGPRVAASTSGSGLGLWIAAAFVTASGGRLQVASEGPGLGSVVALHFPLSTEATQPQVGSDE